MNELSKILDTNEQVFWEGKPRFWPYFLSGVVPTFIFGLAWTGFLVPFFAVNFLPKENLSSSSGFTNTFFFAWNIFLVPFLLIGLWMLVGVHIYKGFIDFDQITNSEVNVGFWDRVLAQNTGSILISSSGTFGSTRQGHIARPYTLSNITDPYEVFKFVKKVSHDVKTDIEYPNAMRPSENPGYQSTYDPNKQ